MTAAMVGTVHDGAGSCPAVDPRVAEDLELPRPLRLLLTAGWNLSESVGLPVAAYAVPSLLAISAVVLTVQTGLVLATGELWLFLLQFPLANLCMCVMFARTARGPDPIVAKLAAEVVALRQPALHHPGLHRFFQGATWLWAGIFLLLTAGLAVLMVTEPTKMFLMLSTVATAALVVAGTGACTWWFLSVLRKLGLRLRFAPA
jgi:hypothetical protein